ncbi:MAG: ARMT1-like domain-containing protein [Candidatus Hydrogenedentes bacterium]|nr:ARMT1-like domain-containing protein [Candidatus Hydrogenedentota bacterium]
MKATLDCLECIASQALRAARVATNDHALQRRIFDETVKRIPEMDLAKSPAELSLIIYELAAGLTGNIDPYKTLKYEQNAAALELEPQLRRLIETSTDPLATSLHLAAAGNIIDLGIQTHGSIDVQAAIQQAINERFAIDHSDEFRSSLSHCRDLLYLLDNAGEIVFDKILIQELQKSTPVTAVVKAGPMINDVLIADAEQVGLTGVCSVIDCGGAFVGSPLGLVPESFKQRLRQADMIVGKGQGNYETLDSFDGDVFLILKAKCAIIAQHIGVDRGQVVLISTRTRKNSRLPQT